MSVVSLRPVEDADLDALFDQMRDPESIRMAAFTAADPADRAAFDATWPERCPRPASRMRAVTCDGRLVGSIAAFVIEGETEVTYWIDRAAWGRASRAGPWNCSSKRSPSGRCTPHGQRQRRVAAGAGEGGLSGHRNGELLRGGPRHRDRRNHPPQGR